MDVREPVDHCIMPVAHAAMQQGSRRHVVPLALRPNGSLIAFPDLRLTTDNPDIATVDGRFEVRALDAGRATITARLDGGICSFSVEVLPPPPPLSFRVGVYDARDGTPLRAQVRAHIDGGVVAVDTDEKGLAIFGSTDLAARLDVQAHPDNPRYPYLMTSILEPASRDIGVALEPRDDSTAVPVSGTFHNVFAQPPTGDVKIGLALAAFESVPPVVSADVLEGRRVAVDVSIAVAGIHGEMFIGTNAYLRFGQSDVKSTFTTWRRGPCSDDGVCTTLVWALGGQIALSRLGILISDQFSADGSDTGPAFIHEILSAHSPRFYHDTSRVISLTGGPDAGPLLIMRPRFDADTFAVRLPVLPARPLGEAPFDRAIALIGPIVDGIGFVPAGAISLAEACPPTVSGQPPCHGREGDGYINCIDTLGVHDRCEGLGAGATWLPMAIRHDGLEGRPLLAVVSAASLHVDPRGLEYSSQVFAIAQDVMSLGFDVDRFAGFARARWLVDEGRLQIASVDDCDALMVRVRRGSGEEVLIVPCRGNQELSLGEGADSVVIEQFDLRSGGYLASHAPGSGWPELDNISRWTRQPCDLPALTSCSGVDDCPIFLGRPLACESGVCTGAEVGVYRTANGECPSGYRSDAINGVFVCRWLPPCRSE